MARSSNRALLIIALALAAYIGLVELRRESEAQRRRRERRALRVEPDRARALRVETEGLRVAVVNENGLWTLAEPVREPADAGVVGRILLALERLPRGETITPDDRRRAGAALSDYGLDPPRARVTVESEGATLSLRIGRATPAGDGLYVMAEGAADVLTTAPGFLSLIPARLDQWRDRALYRVEPARVRRLEVRRPGGALRLERGERGWTVAAPHPARAEPTAVTRLLTGLLSARIGEFVAEGAAQAAAAALDEAALVVELGGENRGLAEPLLVGGSVADAPEWRYARFRNRDILFTIPAQVYALLSAPVEQYRDRRLTPLEPAEIQSIRLEIGDEFLRIAREEGVWKIVEPARAPADADTVEALMRSWSGALVERFTAEAGADADDFQPPLGRVGLSRKAAFDDPAAVFWIQVSRRPPEEERLRVWTSEDPNIHEVTVRLLPLLTPDPLLYRDRRIFRESPESVYRIALARNGVEQAVRREQGGPFVSENGGRADDAALRARLERLLAARARRYVAERPADLTPYGLDPPAATLTLGLRDESGISKTVLIGAVGEHGAYAMLRGRDLVFLLDPDTLRDFVADLAAGAAPTPSPAAEDAAP